MDYRSSLTNLQSSQSGDTYYNSMVNQMSAADLGAAGGTLSDALQAAQAAHQAKATEEIETGAVLEGSAVAGTGILKGGLAAWSKLAPDSYTSVDQAIGRQLPSSMRSSGPSTSTSEGGPSVRAESRTAGEADYDAPTAEATEGGETAIAEAEPITDVSTDAAYSGTEGIADATAELPSYADATATTGDVAGVGDASTAVARAVPQSQVTSVPGESGAGKDLFSRNVNQLAPSEKGGVGNAEAGTYGDTAGVSEQAPGTARNVVSEAVSEKAPMQVAEGAEVAEGGEAAAVGAGEAATEAGAIAGTTIAEEAVGAGAEIAIAGGGGLKK